MKAHVSHAAVGCRRHVKNHAARSATTMMRDVATFGPSQTQSAR
jgi:hypothetical protein